MSSIGTELKINIHVEPIGGLSMDDYDFQADFYVYRNRKVSVRKEEMIRVDENDYIAIVDTERTGMGKIRMRLTAYVPDEDLPDGLRTEIATVDTDITIHGW